MKIAPIPSYEKERLKTLRDYQILDTCADEYLDEITKLASQLTNSPIALISLVDENRQWFKSKQGIDASETPRDISYCGHAVLQDDIFIVENAEKDERFCDNPLFLNSPHVTFYAGVPLKAPNGHNIGTICVIDNKPKQLDESNQKILKNLAKQIILFFELKKKNIKLMQQKILEFNEILSATPSCLKLLIKRVCYLI